MAGLEKQLMLKVMKETLEGNDVFFTRFDKVTVGNFGRLRQGVRKNEGKGIVGKNSIMRIALKELGMEDAVSAIDGSVFLVASQEGPQKVSKELVNFSKEQSAFEIQGVFIDGAFRPKEYVVELSNLPSREQLLASVVGGMKAPITNFVFGLNSIVRSLVVVLNEVSKKKDSN